MEEDRIKEDEASEEGQQKEEIEFHVKYLHFNNLTPPPSIMSPNYYHNPGSNSSCSTVSCDRQPMINDISMW